MKTLLSAASLYGASAVLAAGLLWTAPSASAGSDFCDSLGNPAQIHDCNCGSDNPPGSDEYKQCLHGGAPAPAKPPAPAPSP